MSPKIDPEQLKTLANLNRFNEAYPPREGETWRLRKEQLVYLQPSVRLSVRIERNSDIGHGLWRSDKLGEIGVSDAMLDSMAFANNLFNAIEGELSLHDLENLQAVLDARIRNFRAEREGKPGRFYVAIEHKPTNALLADAINPQN